MISIFAKSAFLNTNPSQPFVYQGKVPKSGHLQRVSSMIRGEQIAEQIGANLNPTEGFEDDVCIYVKPHVQAGEDFEFKGKKSYIDIVDGWGLIPLLEKHPEVGVIACSKQDARLLGRVLPNEVKFIPQHHCNFEGLQRTREGIKTIGVIGTESSFVNLPEGLEEELAKRDIKLLKYSKFFTRQDIIDFYMQIDLQIVWRPYRMRLSNPLKIVNAASFGIPTVAYNEDVFDEVLGCFLPVRDLERLLKEVDILREDSNFYESISDYCLKHAKEYHIKKIGELYKKL